MSEMCAIEASARALKIVKTAHLIPNCMALFAYRVSALCVMQTLEYCVPRKEGLLHCIYIRYTCKQRQYYLMFSLKQNSCH